MNIEENLTYIKNKILNNKFNKSFNEIFMDKTDKKVKELFLETTEDILKEIDTEKKERKKIIRTLDNLISTQKSCWYKLDELRNIFLYDCKDLRVYALEYKKYYKNEIASLKKEISFECGKAIDWIATKPFSRKCEYLRPFLCEKIMGVEIRPKNNKEKITLKIIEEIIKNNEIKECLLKETLEYDKKLIKLLKQK